MSIDFCNPFVSFSESHVCNGTFAVKFYLNVTRAVNPDHLFCFFLSPDIAFIHSRHLLKPYNFESCICWRVSSCVVMGPAFICPGD